MTSYSALASPSLTHSGRLPSTSSTTCKQYTRSSLPSRGLPSRPTRAPLPPLVDADDCAPLPGIVVPAPASGLAPAPCKYNAKHAFHVSSPNTRTLFRYSIACARKSGEIEASCEAAISTACGIWTTCCDAEGDVEARTCSEASNGSEVDMVCAAAHRRIC